MMTEQDRIDIYKDTIKELRKDIRFYEKQIVNLTELKAICKARGGDYNGYNELIEGYEEIIIKVKNELRSLL